MRPTRSCERASTRRVCAPSRAASRTQIVERVHVIDEIRRVERAATARARRSARRCPGRRRGSNSRVVGERERVRRPVGRRGEREAAVGDRAGEREQVARGRARQVGVDDEVRRRQRRRRRRRRAPARTAAPWPRRGSATCVDAVGQLAAPRRDDEHRPDRRRPRRARPRASPARAARGPRSGTRSRRRFGSRAAEGDDDGRHPGDTTAATWRCRARAYRRCPERQSHSGGTMAGARARTQ